jgi:3-hydroxyisobutyrate dehydrogenase-like beta-hydroxyacid dehydrogenase
MKVGFIGLGNMGSGMAANLLKAGHEVVVYNRTPAKAQPLIGQGARLATIIADACHGDAVFTMLADDTALESVIFAGAGNGSAKEDNAGLLASLGKNAIHISSSTISVALADKVSSAHAARGQRFVSAPVFGRPEAAAAAKLFVVAAGAAHALESCAPLFDAIGQKTFRFGDQPSSANLIKLSGNFLIAAVLESLSEALALVGKAGIDQRQYLDFLTSTLFVAPVYKTYGSLIIEKKFQPAGFAAPLGLKDVRLALAAGETLRVPLPLASLIRDRFLTLLARGGESLDWSAISQVSAEDSGQGRST